MIEEKNCSYSQRDQATSRKLEEAYKAVDELKHANRQLDAQVLELDQENDSLFRQLEDTQHELGLSKEATANARAFASKLEGLAYDLKRRVDMAASDAAGVRLPPGGAGGMWHCSPCAHS
jgi:predicted RNase H-like nuclease (RuvC/YqgF family)